VENITKVSMVDEMTAIYGGFLYTDSTCEIAIGRGKSSHAYFHSLHEDHHVFINLESLKVGQMLKNMIIRRLSGYGR